MFFLRSLVLDPSEYFSHMEQSQQRHSSYNVSIKYHIEHSKYFNLPRALNTSSTTAGQAETGSLKTSIKFSFEMASIELEKKKKSWKKEANSVVSAQYKVTPGQL